MVTSCRKPGFALRGNNMAGKLRLRVNGAMRDVESAPDTPLLYVLTDEMHLQGPRFGCGLSQCGSCSVLLDGAEIRSCVTPVSVVNGKSITTLEGLPHWYAEQKKLAKAPQMHPIQQAVIDEQAVQCGYCYNGLIIQAADLLSKNPRPSDREIRAAMNGHLCRCGSYPRMIRAVRRASEMMHGGRAVADSAGAAENELAENAAADGSEVAR
jgi:aerobic-type carbon monoxide dehydrogenase small subunit (CoxS/CutS family)